MMTTSSPSRQGTGPSRRKTFLATVIGHVIEWFDFAAYALVAVYIGHQFFPNENESMQLIATFATFALTFLFRPLGAVVFGPLSDRIGRLKVLALVLLIMSVATTAIGLLPTYDTIGIAAPILLVALRCLQGLSAGGESGSSVAFMLEHSKPGHRGFGNSWVTFAATVGFMLGSAVAAILALTLGEQAMNDWGWRLPFLVAGPLGIIGLYIRLKLEDTPDFKALERKGEVSKSPVREVFAYKRELLTTILICSMHSAGFYMILTYLNSYITTTTDFGSDIALTGTLVGAACTLIPIPFLAAYSDRIGRKPILISASIAMAVMTLPLFAFIRTSPAAAVIGLAVFGLLLGCVVSVTLCTTSEIFPARVRGAGFSIGFGVASAAVGGTAPLIATALYSSTDNVYAPAGFLIAVCVLGFIGSMILIDRSREELLVDAAPAIGGDDDTVKVAERV
ncbi:MFS transporter [Gordonia sp. PKS22-38]|uniref:MFS transporter n=1 Tax=Gordonia prachuapensis TaxID=3115651 RepID=A0ABU7MVD8_9ACTN|nr:MFS transporter [Gordonia sp. PKS22-38]